MTDFKMIKKSDRVVLSGEVDVSNAVFFKSSLYDIADEARDHVILDLEHLRYIDSAGMGILVGAYKRLQQKSLMLRVVRPVENIRKLFSVTRLDTLIHVSDSWEETT